MNVWLDLAIVFLMTDYMQLRFELPVYIKMLISSTLKSVGRCMLSLVTQWNIPLRSYKNIFFLKEDSINLAIVSEPRTNLYTLTLFLIVVTML